MAGDAMSDDIIDTINDPLIDLAGHGKLLSTMASKKGRGLAHEVLSALDAAGYAIVELPEPTENGPHLEWRRLCFENAVVWTIPGGHVMIQNIEPGDLMPSNARDVAAAVLAAAGVGDRSEERIAATEADQ